MSRLSLFAKSAGLLFISSVSSLSCGGEGASISGPAPSPSGDAPPGSPSKDDESRGEPGTSQAGCASTKACIEADVAWADGTKLHFAHAAEFNPRNDRWSLTAVDESTRFGIMIFWKPGEIRSGTSYPSKDAVELWLIQKHPTDSKKLRASVTNGGSIVFTRTGAVEGEPASGTFEGLDRVNSDPDDGPSFKVSAGSFRAAGI